MNVIFMKLLDLLRYILTRVIEKSGMETRHVMAILTNLELKEAIKGMPGGFYLRS